MKNKLEADIERDVLEVLFDYRMRPDNKENRALRLSDIALFTQVVEEELIRILEGLDKLVEECEQRDGERTFRISGTGVREVRNEPSGAA